MIMTRDIQTTVARAYELRRTDIIGKRQTRRIMEARSVAMHLTKELTGVSYVEIGLDFGGRDHSTVVNAVNLVRSRMENDDALRDCVDHLKKVLKKVAVPRLEDRLKMVQGVAA